MNEVHFKNTDEVSIAWDEATGRVWVCINGRSIFRSKINRIISLFSFDEEFAGELWREEQCKQQQVKEDTSSLSETALEE